MVEMKLKPEKSAFVRKKVIKVIANYSTPSQRRMFIMEQRRYNLGDEQSRLNAEDNAISCIRKKVKKLDGVIHQLKIGNRYQYGNHYVDKTSNRWC